MSSKPKSLIFWITVGLFLGTLMGGFLPEVSKQFSILGEIFMNLLKMMVVPLIITALIIGVTALNDVPKLSAIGR